MLATGAELRAGNTAVVHAVYYERPTEREPHTRPQEAQPQGAGGRAEKGPASLRWGDAGCRRTRETPRTDATARLCPPRPHAWGRLWVRLHGPTPPRPLGCLARWALAGHLCRLLPSLRSRAGRLPPLRAATVQGHCPAGGAGRGCPWGSLERPVLAASAARRLLGGQDATCWPKRLRSCSRKTKVSTVWGMRRMPAGKRPL